ncbi:hypothetical protein Hanom_Chr15g01394761 [Helianthus anomalus]
MVLPPFLFGLHMEFQSLFKSCSCNSNSQTSILRITIFSSNSLPFVLNFRGLEKIITSIRRII